jgi:hypothetical protein
MEKYPNLYRLKNHKILEISKDMPFEIMERDRLHREYCLRLSQSTGYAEISLKIYNLRESRPTVDATHEQYEEWETLVKELWDTIPEKYKTAFNMSLDSRGIHTFVFESL